MSEDCRTLSCNSGDADRHQKHRRPSSTQGVISLEQSLVDQLSEAAAVEGKLISYESNSSRTDRTGVQLVSHGQRRPAFSGSLWSPCSLADSGPN